MNFSIVDPFTDEPVQPRPAQHRREGRGLPEVHRHRRHRLLRRRGGVLRLRRRALQDLRQRIVLLRGRLQGRRGTPAGSRRRQPGYKPRMKGGYFPVSPVDHLPTCDDDLPDPQGGRSLRRALAPRGRLGRQQEINYRFNTLLHSGDDMMKFKYVVKNTAWRTARRRPSCRSRSSATTARACTPTSPVEGRRAAVLRRARLRRLSRPRPLVHRWPAQARARRPRLHQPDGQLLPPSGPGLRGPGQPGLLGP